MRKSYFFSAIAILIFSIGFGLSFFIKNSNADTYQYDPETCYVAHSGTNNVCNNHTYGYSWQGNGTFINNFSVYYTGYSDHILGTKMVWTPEQVTAGKPYYLSAYVYDHGGDVVYYGRSYSGTQLSSVSQISMSMNNNIDIDTSNMDLSIVSDLNAAVAGTAYRYESIIYPR